MRLALALLGGAVTAAFGAVILGEYQLAGFTGAIAGALFGLAVAEVVLSAGGPAVRARQTAPMIAAAVFTAAGLAWAGWISAGHLWGEVPPALWLGIVIGAPLSAWWLRGGARRGAAPATGVE
ncbi:MAG: hypothetical protein H0W70_11675 [Actinobacteria bacterium]|nr:hypothetical protein [Actinomycetota bacterium]